jgi:ketosteroid isomerase-like protein
MKARQSSDWRGKDMTVSEDVRKAMQETNERFCREVVANGKFDAIGSIYTKGARVLPPGAPMMVKGQDAIKGFWKAAIAALGVTGAKLTTVDAEMAGDTVVEIGAAELELGAKGTASAKYIVHWKREDGRWLWDKDIWNMNA